MNPFTTDDDDIHTLTEEEWAMVQRHREARAVAEAVKAEHQVQADELAEHLNGLTWIQADGTHIPVAKMTPRHARHALRFAVRKVYQWRQESALAGNAPAFAVPDEWPLVQALMYRGSQESSLLDRLKDRRDLRRHEKRSAKR